MNLQERESPFRSRRREKPRADQNLLLFDLKGIARHGFRSFITLCFVSGESMIVPLASEEEWGIRLSKNPVWTDLESEIRGPVLVISPHPDDETLGAGGLIAQLRSLNVDVIVAAVTDGENAYGESVVLGEARAAEQTAALAQLGVEDWNIHRFRICDSDVSSHEDALTRLLNPLVARCNHILSPWRHDFHPDHEACGRIAEKLAEVHRVRLTSYFFWTWHRSTPELLEGLQLVNFPLSAQLLETKLQALRCHQSQLHRDSGDPILPGRLLAPAYRNFETYLPSRVPYAS
jgi:LmbE family N-acetylglucosaminyl deacetylase